MGKNAKPEYRQKTRFIVRIRQMSLSEKT